MDGQTMIKYAPIILQHLKDKDIDIMHVVLRGEDAKHFSIRKGRKTIGVAEIKEDGKVLVFA